jgi:hypothetical protein
MTTPFAGRRSPHPTPIGCGDQQEASERDRLVMWFFQECDRRGMGVMELLDQIVAEHTSPAERPPRVTR